jgi:hypothetical protein
VTLVFNDVNSDNDLQQRYLFGFENKVEISAPNPKFCTFIPSAITFKTSNEGEKNSKENTMPTTWYFTVVHESSCW